MSREELESRAAQIYIGEQSTYLGSIIPAKVTIGAEAVDAEGLSLATSPVHVTKHEDTDTGVVEYEAVFEHPPLQGEQLLKLMTHVAPDSGADSITGVWADWILPDIPQGGQVFGDGIVLNAHTQALGRHWTDFEASRRQLINALVSGTGNYSFLKSDQLVTLVGEDTLKKRFEKGNFDINSIDSLFTCESIPSPNAMLVGFMADDGKISKKTINRFLASHK